MTRPPNASLPAPSRRQFVLGASAALAAASLPSAFSFTTTPRAHVAPAELSGSEIDLTIGYQAVNFTGNQRLATTVNNSLPGPTLRLREGQSVTLNVTNALKQDSSIHWHGIILPTGMDGVPGMSFDGIKPGQTFQYQFTANQSGTYWYHSHSGFQEQTGVYGALIVDAAEPDPFAYDRDYVVMLSDWTDEDPHNIYAKLKKMSHYYNYNERTLQDWWRDVRAKGFLATWRDREMWNQMRMSDTDIADVTGSTYTYLVNGSTPDRGWVGIFNKGEKIRLRFINAAAMTLFDVRIPGLKMTVVAADGQNVQPVPVDEFRIGIAETYDVIVEPDQQRAYTLFAQSIDRTGYARGTLTTNAEMLGAVPVMDPPPVLGHRDMGMGHGGMNDAAMGHGAHGDEHAQQQTAISHAGAGQEPADYSQMNHGEMNHAAMGVAERPDDLISHQGTDHAPMDHAQHGEVEPVVAHEHHPQHNTPAPLNMPAAVHQGHSTDEGVGIQALAITTENLGTAGFGSNAPIQHLRTEFGPHVDMHLAAPQSGLSDPGIGLRENQQLYGRRVLSYADLRNLTPTIDKRQPSRELQIHLTGNMGRYMWSMNGVTHADAAPIELHYGERVRILLVNDTMMTHPIHLHGMWSELETGDPDFIPRKHTVLVQPGASISYLVSADAKGRWAYHCHLLFHMAGMMREVRVS